MNIFITGGTGSFGQAFVRKLLSDGRFERIVIYSRDEVKQGDMRHALEKEFPETTRLRFFLGDVREENRLDEVIRGNAIDWIVHAAALKQIPTLEYNPTEAVATNIYGAVNVIHAALQNGVKKVIALSSDKATAPLNLYGSTKKVAEHLFVAANGFRPTRFACVRYGNVIGSRGSVIPLWREQAMNGPITITDADMTRFWITLDQGVQFVLSCFEQMQGGEVFVPKLPSCTIGDLARAVAPTTPIQHIGLRPGEKMHETLISNDEARQTRDLGDRYVIYPAIREFALEERGERVPDNFVYCSATGQNPTRPYLSQEQLKEMVANI